MMDSGFQELLDEFLLEARERADEVETLMLRLASENFESRQASIAQAKRELHTLKGNSGMMGFTDLQQLAHLLEDEVESLDLKSPHLEDILSGLDTMRSMMEAIRAPDLAEEVETGSTEPEAAAPADVVATSVRVPFTKIDQMVEYQAESLIFRNRLADAVGRGLLLMARPPEDTKELLSRSLEAWDEVESARQALEKTLNVLQEQVTELGMVPLQSLFRSLGRIIHDESAREGKKVDLGIRGGETPIDKALLEVASEVLGHLVRNAVNHGVEPPDVRRRLRKPETGRVQVSAALEAGEVRIDVVDDGAGIDLESLRAKADQLGAEIDAEGPGSEYSLIFADGISTREDADLGAGRGVGMSAVKRSVDRHGGRIEVHSERGVGSRFTLRLPLTTSILRSLLLTADGEEYALPLSAVTETQRLGNQEHHEVNHARVVSWRGLLVPLLDLGLAFGTAPRVREQGYAVIINVHGRYRGLAIDDIVGIRDIVFKGLDSIVGQPMGISGSTILGDGRVVMILDPNALVSIPPFVGKGVEGTSARASDSRGKAG